MNKKWTYKDIEKLILNETEENRSLEYKGSGSLGKSDGKKNEISKDVSAFANSNGGILIYGVKEYNEKDKNHLPEKIDAIDRTKFSKEWLEQVINSKIQPKIKGVIIDSIDVPEEENGVIYVVKIPKSNTAHQSSSLKYYRRGNFEVVAMLDYEIRDVMNRGSHPEIELNFEIEKIYKTTNSKGVKNQQNILSNLKITLINKGSVYANYVNYYATFNRDILDKDEIQGLKTFYDENKKQYFVEYYGENTIRDVISSKFESNLLGGEFHDKYGSSRFDPILPGMHSRPEKLKIKSNLAGFYYGEIKWKVFADNATPKEGSIKIEDIPINEIFED